MKNTRILAIVFTYLGQNLISVIFTGISSFLAGQVMSYTGLSISLTFQAFSIYCSSAATLFYLIYLIKGRKLESIRIKEVETERMKLENMEEKSTDEVSTISTYL